MADFNYGDVIEYIDCTYDENFEEAKSWAKANDATLEELVERRKSQDGKLHRFFYLKKREIIEPSIEDKEVVARLLRNELLNGIEWRVNRYKDQKELGIKTDDDEETYMDILAYMQYLRDIPSDSDFPNIKIKTFDEWKE